MASPQASQSVQERLIALCQLAKNLKIDEEDLSFSSYSASIVNLSDELLSLRRSLNQMLLVEDELQDHLSLTRHEQLLIDKWTISLEKDQETGETPAVLERRREGLLKKAKEYHKELTAVMALMPTPPSVTVTRLTEQQSTNKLKEQELKAKRAKVKAFQGLPPNLELARHELRNARSEQMKLIQLRERLLGRMAESVT
ncbi:hypothetical protein Hypma_004295 [Hypsizygus marmoreus]|uniref:Uncharacterized protein n=1 Tax=Hypsizygus marmoreus TaxID=39966 RepID=A0A369JY61_HYPMA|nr:hypothetical protein Hypma_004295 [Hypsizygus marmoreus]